MLPLTLKDIAQALSLAPESSLQLTTPLTTRFPSLTVNTPFAVPSWSLDDPSSAANVLVPEIVTSCARTGSVIRARRDNRSLTDRDRIQKAPPCGCYIKLTRTGPRSCDARFHKRE